MSWFGGGKKEDNAPKDFTSHEDSGFAESTNLMAAAGGGGGGNAMAELQQASMVIQQQLMVQQVINDLSDRSYERCITSKPSETLTGSQAACVRATVNKWLDSNEFMTGRLAKKSQQQQQQHF